MNRPFLEAKGISIAYGKQVVLDDVSFVISEGQKIALIGRNGSGKSTLLNILTGQEEADGGTVTLLPWTKLGMVAQHDALPSDCTTLEYLERIGAKPSWTVQKQAAMFGVHSDHLALPPSALSGGYQMRVKIIAMLLQDPTLLLLDEPVNYLDLPTLLLLERFLATYRGSFVITAHDREFLQNTCTHTFEIERAELTSYAGPVNAFLEWKEEQKEFIRKTNKRVSREIAHTQVFVDRFRYRASLASRAQNKIKHIERLRKSIVAIKKDLSTTRMRISTPPIPTGVAVRAEKLTIGYRDAVIAKDITFSVARGEKVVIAGENGKGKSTLLKTLAGIIPAQGGTIKWWHRSNIGYYDQKSDATLLPNETVLGYLTRMAPINASGEQILMMAGNFLFRNDDLEKTTSVLSGGERARLCLAGVLLHEHSVLILDEPTNHLDVETAESLASALKEYGGTVIFVSHARTFVHALADRVYEIGPSGLRQYPGSYEDYVADLSALADEEGTDEAVGANPGAQLSTTEHISTSPDRALRRAQLKEKQRRAEKIQIALEKADKEKSALLAFFFENPTDYAPEKAQKLSQIDEELSALEQEWYAVQQAIEELRS